MSHPRKCFHELNVVAGSGGRTGGGPGGVSSECSFRSGCHSRGGRRSESPGGGRAPVTGRKKPNVRRRHCGPVCGTRCPRPARTVPVSRASRSGPGAGGIGPRGGPEQARRGRGRGRGTRRSVPGGWHTTGDDAVDGGPRAAGAGAATHGSRPGRRRLRAQLPLRGPCPRCRRHPPARLPITVTSPVECLIERLARTSHPSPALIPPLPPSLPPRACAPSPGYAIPTLGVF